ncbi:hypothetical protein PPERSA_07725 [Pseudocohnilembus persalinus]|uniref:Uncharacterized protein n=1 Tax=Pseudocohnilembus persalinus TaxID=266149 RepID=A0A0V0RA05_PSEPJ|nr:hypothetical protein PPERSA_07725 [Pseudocohnilembus persalinus]|eukprot:KRX11200.1 hypothetical protein PPERSA_07725 [Pseudocohnilembus persalinus]
MESFQQKIQYNSFEQESIKNNQESSYLKQQKISSNINDYQQFFEVSTPNGLKKQINKQQLEKLAENQEIVKTQNFKEQNKFNQSENGKSILVSSYIKHNKSNSVKEYKEDKLKSFTEKSQLCQKIIAQKIQEIQQQCEQIQDHYGQQIEKILLYFDSLEQFLQLQKNRLLEKMNEIQQSQVQDLEKKIQCFEINQQKIQTFNQEIEENSTSIINEMEKEPFNQVIENYFQKVNEYQNEVKDFNKFEQNQCKYVCLSKFKEQKNDDQIIKNKYLDLEEIEIEYFEKNTQIIDQLIPILKNQYEMDEKIAQNFKQFDKDNVQNIKINQNNQAQIMGENNQQLNEQLQQNQQLQKGNFNINKQQNQYQYNEVNNINLDLQDNQEQDQKIKYQEFSEKLGFSDKKQIFFQQIKEEEEDQEQEYENIVNETLQILQEQSQKQQDNHNNIDKNNQSAIININKDINKPMPFQFEQQNQNLEQLLPENNKIKNQFTLQEINKTDKSDMELSLQEIQSEEPLNESDLNYQNQNFNYERQNFYKKTVQFLKTSEFNYEDNNIQCLQEKQVQKKNYDQKMLSEPSTSDQKYNNKNEDQDYSDNLSFQQQKQKQIQFIRDSQMRILFNKKINEEIDNHSNFQDKNQQQLQQYDLKSLDDIQNNLHDNKKDSNNNKNQKDFQQENLFVNEDNNCNKNLNNKFKQFLEQTQLQNNKNLQNNQENDDEMQNFEYLQNQSKVSKSNYMEKLALFKQNKILKEESKKHLRSKNQTQTQFQYQQQNQTQINVFNNNNHGHSLSQQTSPNKFFQQIKEKKQANSQKKKLFLNELDIQICDQKGNLQNLRKNENQIKCKENDEFSQHLQKGLNKLFNQSEIYSKKEQINQNNNLTENKEKFGSMKNSVFFTINSPNNRVLQKCDKNFMYGSQLHEINNNKNSGINEYSQNLSINSNSNLLKKCTSLKNIKFNYTEKNQQKSKDISIINQGEYFQKSPNNSSNLRNQFNNKFEVLGVNKNYENQQKNNDIRGNQGLQSKNQKLQNQKISTNKNINLNSGLSSSAKNCKMLLFNNNNNIQNENKKKENENQKNQQNNENIKEDNEFKQYQLFTQQFAASRKNLHFNNQENKVMDQEDQYQSQVANQNNLNQADNKKSNNDKNMNSNNTNNNINNGSNSKIMNKNTWEQRKKQNNFRSQSSGNLKKYAQVMQNNINNINNSNKNQFKNGTSQNPGSYCMGQQQYQQQQQQSLYKQIVSIKSKRNSQQIVKSQQVNQEINNKLGDVSKKLGFSNLANQNNISINNIYNNYQGESNQNQQNIRKNNSNEKSIYINILKGIQQKSPLLKENVVQQNQRFNI